MKEQLEALLRDAVQKLKADGVLPADLHPSIQITPSRGSEHGDFATNLALMLAKESKMTPRILAEKILSALPPSSGVKRVEIAGPGFINFFLAEEKFQSVISTVLTQGDTYGHADIGKGERVHIEYVSANPTGPLHVGHGRGAAYGACVASLLRAANFNVHREYYVNDVGRQMGILALSVWVRYLQDQKETIELPKNAYQGEYVIDIARDLEKQYGQRFHRTQAQIATKLPKTGDFATDPESYLDAYIQAAKETLQDDFQIIFSKALESILADIKDDLAEFGVVYDEWFFESRLWDKGLVKEAIALLEKHGYVYEQEGAKWFRATSLGDEKDRVLIRKNGIATYFTADVAYHLYKNHQGYQKIIDVLGADHHGYVPRIRAVLKGLGEDPKKLHVLLVQFAILYRGTEKISMSTRAGTFVTLRELRQEVGNDAARFFYIMRKPEQHLDFDLELAKSKSSENPVYYIQYAHARICSIWRQLKAQLLQWDKAEGLAQLSLLASDYEKELLAVLAQYPDVFRHAVVQYEPHLLAHFLQTLANHFHTYYNAERFLVNDSRLRNARLALIAAIQQVLKNGLMLLGVSAPDEM